MIGGFLGIGCKVERTAGSQVGPARNGVFGPFVNELCPSGLDGVQCSQVNGGVVSR